MRILLVDDDSSVLRALLAVLREMPGHEVRPATSAAQALETAGATGGVDLLVTDVVMEPMDGFTLSEQLQALYPGMRTIFVSGFDLADYPERVGQWQVLTKPIEPGVIEAAVERENTAHQAGAPRTTAPAGVVARPQPVAVPRVASVGPPSAPQPKAVQAVPAQPKAVPAQPRAAQPAAVPTVRAQPPAASAPRAVPVPNATRPSHPSVQPTVAKASPVSPPVMFQPKVPTVAAKPSVSSPRPVATGAPSQPRVTAPAGVPAPSRPAVVAVPSAPPAVPASPANAEAEGSPNHSSTGLIGQIGGYHIVSQLGEGRWGTVYAAVQTAINRPVGLKVLDPARAQDETQKQRFIADARAKAHVQHPSILSVYEAGSADGWTFYTHEYVDGQNLAEMYASGRTIDETAALKVLKVAAEGLLYLSRNNVPHAALQPADIYLGIDNHPRLANLAAQTGDQQLTVEQEIEVLGQAIWPVLKQPVSERLQDLIARTQQSNPGAITAWGPLLQGIKALEPKIIPVEAEKISAQERAASAAAEKARKAQKRAFYLNLTSMVALAVFAAWAIWFYLLRSNERLLDQEVHIPAGEFIFGEGQTATVPEFWIDKYEVTIGQYAKFVEWINANSGEEHAYDHEKQPKQLSHIPEYWDIYYLNARAGKAAHKAPIDLNCPMITVTWWDAYAYAKWKGRQLPTEEEWERAGRGTDGRAYPWGDDGDTKKANTSADFQANDPGAYGAIDGFNFWGPVDKQKYDKSPDGVIGLAGNVSEWIGVWNKENTKPILKGGNFSVPLKKLSDREAVEPGKKEEFIGFRTVTHKRPGQ